MTAGLLDALQLPDRCRLDKRVFKKLFLENAKLTPQDRRAFSNDVEEVVWEYTLKPSTIAIMPYADDEHEYDEIAVLQATLKSPKNASRIAEVIQRSIPYPLVLVLCCESQELLSLAPKRFSRSEKGATVAEEFVTTGWMTLAAATAPESAFVDSIALDNLPQSNYLMLYTALIERALALRSSRRTGDYHVVSDRVGQAERRRLLAEADNLEGQVNECRAALKHETQFNRKVDLNTKIKQLETRLKAVIAELKTPNGA